MFKSDNFAKVKIALLAMQRYSWEQGVAMQAFLEAGDYDIVIAMAKEAAYRSVEDGRTAIIGGLDAVTDPCAVGEALLYAAKAEDDKELMKAHEALLNWALNEAPRNKDGIVYHVSHANEFWVDSMYMLAPYLAAAGYYEEAVKQVYGYWDKLYNPEKKLLSHMWNDEKEEFIRKDFWGVGNGWTMATLVRLIDLLPEEMNNERNKLIEMAKELIESVSEYIREDGLAHDVLDNPSTFIEVNLPQMFAYSIYRGIKSAWLAEGWKEVADKCRKAVETKVDQYGLVQDVCGAPNFSSAGVAPEGQAFYILMQSAANKLDF